MTIESLRGRLAAERSAAKAARFRIEELEKKVQRLERNLRMEMHKRMIAETALQESLEKMLSSGTSSCMSTDSELDTLSREALRTKEIPVQKDDTDSLPLKQKHLVAEKEEGGEEESSELSKALRLPCAASLEPHTQNSDSDWSEDDEELNSSAIVNLHGESDAQRVQLDEQATLPYELHLSQLDLARKIGRSLKEWRRSRQSKTSMDMMVHLDKQEKQEDSPQEEQQQQTCTSSQDGVVPYVSFSKYLGMNRFVAVGTDDERGTLWKIKEHSRKQLDQDEDGRGVSKIYEKERMDEILRAFNYIKFSP